MLDDHGQPINRRFNYSQNVQKALQDLLGICQGIVADQHITSDEALFLDVWLRNNRILENDPDYRDLLELTTDILEDGILTVEELDDLKELISTIIDYRSDQGFANEKEAVQRLLGICKGVSADQELNESEIIVLSNWVDRSVAWIESPVVANIHAAVRAVLQDGLITEDEQKSLLELLYKTTGDDPRMGLTGGLSIGAFADSIEAVEFVDCSFCFTGQFTYGSRSECQKVTANQGGSIHKTVTKKTQYLVIGELSSRDWTNTSFGRKVEKAIQYRKQGIPIAILHEELWLKHLDY